MKYLQITVTTVFFALVAAFLSAPTLYMQSFLDGATVWAYNVLPALFPFAVLTPLALKFFPNGKFSLCKVLFGVQADGAYVTSLLCGYPMGAKAVAECAPNAEIATQMCSFCSSAGPIFVAATVGGKLLGSTAATLVIVVSHLASTVANGLLYRKKREISVQFVRSPIKAGDVGDTVTGSVLSVLSVGGLIALFYMLADVIKSFVPAPISQSVATGFLLGLLEMTNGIISVCATCDLLSATVLSSFLLGFGGLCVFAQSLALLGNKVRPAKFLQMKLTQGAIATLISAALALLVL